jgi:DNA-binding transcriptional LysR family regulator
MVDLRTLNAFVEIVRHGGFRSASDRLGTTQPALSARIAKLEHTLGVTVLTRTSRGIMLTEAGRTLLDYAERMIALRSDMLAAVAAPTARAGLMRIGVAETIVQTWLPAFLRAATEAFPGLAFEIEVDVSPRLRERLTSHDLDMAFMLGPTATPALVDTPLCVFDVAFFTTPTVAMERKRWTLAAVSSRPIVTFARNTQPFAQLSRRLRAEKIVTPRIHASASVATIAQMARDGLGIAFLPGAAVREDVAAHRLVALDVRPLFPPLTFVTATAATNDRRLIDALSEIARVASRNADSAGRSRTKRDRAGAQER